MHGVRRGLVLDGTKLLRRELDGGRAEVLVEPVPLRRAGDRDDPGLLCQEPCDGDLGTGRPAAVGDPRAHSGRSTSRRAAMLSRLIRGGLSIFAEEAGRGICLALVLGPCGQKFDSVTHDGIGIVTRVEGQVAVHAVVNDLIAR